MAHSRSASRDQPWGLLDAHGRASHRHPASAWHTGTCGKWTACISQGRNDRQESTEKSRGDYQGAPGLGANCGEPPPHQRGPPHRDPGREDLGAGQSGPGAHHRGRGPSAQSCLLPPDLGWARWRELGPQGTRQGSREQSVRGAPGGGGVQLRSSLASRFGWPLAFHAAPPDAEGLPSQSWKRLGRADSSADQRRVPALQHRCHLPGKLHGTRGRV